LREESSVAEDMTMTRRMATSELMAE